MLGLLIDGCEFRPPTPITDIRKIKIWEKIARAADPSALIDACILPEDATSNDWLTENLPPTNPPSSTRPGAEYGVDV
jgi:hypothetical protein